MQYASYSLVIASGAMGMYGPLNHVHPQRLSVDPYNGGEHVSYYHFRSTILFLLICSLVYPVHDELAYS